MNNEQVISDEVLATIEMELSKNNNWLEVNANPYFLEKKDVFFFKSKEEAYGFISNNISEYDSFKLMYAESIADVFRQIPYGEKLSGQIINSHKNQLS